MSGKTVDQSASEVVGKIVKWTSRAFVVLAIVFMSASIIKMLSLPVPVDTVVGKTSALDLMYLALGTAGVRYLIR